MRFLCSTRSRTAPYGSGTQSFASPVDLARNRSYGPHGYPPASAMSAPSWKGLGLLQNQVRNYSPEPQSVLGLLSSALLVPSHWRRLRRYMIILKNLHWTLNNWSIASKKIIIKIYRMLWRSEAGADNGNSCITVQSEAHSRSLIFFSLLYSTNWRRTW